MYFDCTEKMPTHTYLTLTYTFHCYAISCAAHNKFMCSLCLISLLRLTSSQQYSWRSFSHLRLRPCPLSSLTVTTTPLLSTATRHNFLSQQRQQQQDGGTIPFMPCDQHPLAAPPFAPRRSLSNDSLSIFQSNLTICQLTLYLSQSSIISLYVSRLNAKFFWV